MFYINLTSLALLDVIWTTCFITDTIGRVMDEEYSIVQSMEVYLPRVTRLGCWNHTVNSVKA